MERILLSRVDDLGENEYLVKWEGYDEPTWESYEIVKDLSALDAFEEEQSALETNAAEASGVRPPIINDEPTFEEAMRSPYAPEWREAMDVELAAHGENATWEDVDVSSIPGDAKLIDSKWILKVKRNPDHSIKKFKVRLVARGDRQRPGIDFGDVYAPVIKLTTERIVLAVAAHLDMEIHQMDVVTAFLNGSLDRVIYMKLPPDENGKRRVVKLVRALYGLKQSPRLWNKTIDTYLKSEGFEACPYDNALYLKHDPNGRIIAMIALYVDDLTICTKDKAYMNRLKEKLNSRFKMEDMGELRYILGIEVARDREKRTISLGQHKYIDDLIIRHGLTNAKTSQTPLDPNVHLRTVEGEKPVDIVEYQSIVGGLMWLMLGTRPDLAFAVSKLSQFNSKPTTSHRTQALRVLRYVKGTRELKLIFGLDPDAPLCGYSDADYAGDVDTRRSTTGYVFKLYGGAVSWMAKRQRSTALSTCEAEYMALAEAAREAVWLRNLMMDILRSGPDAPITIYEDNQSAMKLVYNPVDHQRTKHIDIRYHFTREAVEDNLVQLTYVPSEDMVADQLTKPLPFVSLIRHRLEMGLQ